MCGFVTIYSDQEKHLQTELLISMTNTLTHRGPDDYGFAFAGPDKKFVWHDNAPDFVTTPGIFMGHRRLSIIDLSEAGRQPFVSRDKRFWMVYNGEVFNYIELRDELRGLGTRFDTETDTEVVLEAYRHWGIPFLNRLNGMWALVIWDDLSRTLIVARDRYGIKPLFYSQIDGQWIFSSEIKALLKHPGISSLPRNQAIFRFLWAARSPEAEETYFKGVLSVPAASYLLIKEGKLQKHTFWQLPEYMPASKRGPEDISEQFITLFRDSVRLRLRADVRVGTMMSGGLDSTSIVKTINDLLSEHVEEAASLHDIQQIVSACFPKSNIDETDRVQDLVNMLGLSVEKVFPAQENVQEIFHNVVQAMEMPFKSSTPLVQYLLMHRARSMGLTVVLNGHGSDEMLGGYPYRYRALVAAEYFLRFRFLRWFREVNIIKRMYNTGNKELAYILLDSFPIAGMLARDILRSSKKKLFRREIFRKYELKDSRIFDKKTGGRTILDRRLRRDFFGEVLPMWLVMEDRISMSASVESRLPFMDYRLVEFAFGLKDSDKIKDGITKYILRNAMRDQLPSSVVNERSKYYFKGPDLYWLKSSLRSVLDNHLMKGSPRISEFMCTDQFRQLITRVLDHNGGDYWDNRLVWRMFMTEAWMREFFN
ncbi:MAG: asparagine synthase (glutamine-hydrolyzing) [Candidatus Omnitrophota bacterium]